MTQSLVEMPQEIIEHQLCKAAVGMKSKVNVIRNILTGILISIIKVHNLNKGKM
jgi:hypothetical protein